MSFEGTPPKILQLGSEGTYSQAFLTDYKVGLPFLLPLLLFF
jgi:hypothetical protein